MRFTPFDKRLADIVPDDLATLFDVHEGWYVEYKEQLTLARSLAKSLSSFANQYGGFLFFGVTSDRETTTAHSFPGIDSSSIPRCLQSLKEASKDLLHPDVFFSTRVFEGPIPSIGLDEGRAILVAEIPPGPDTPYVHNDGHIYLRIGDSSEPRPATDRATFDLLFRRGEESRLQLEDRIQRSPVVSKGEKQKPYIHLSILSDPYEIMGHWYGGNLDHFSSTMREKSIPFDNIFSMSNGYIARQTANNDAYGRTFTWEFSRHCHSHVTLPIPMLAAEDRDPALDVYSTWSKFLSYVENSGLEFAQILDLNIIFDALQGIIKRHRILAAYASVKGPFFVKAYLENTWRTVPFLDLGPYLTHIKTYGVPIVQEDEILVPNGTSLQTFWLAPELEGLPRGSDPDLSFAISATLGLLQALGIPGDVLADTGGTLSELGRRRMAYQKAHR